MSCGALSSPRNDITERATKAATDATLEIRARPAGVGALLSMTMGDGAELLNVVEWIMTSRMAHVAMK